ncbi:Wzz/FepE/Etk N-terminal domain-containing protein (plasmid) [Legionella sp. D16C41]|uniref:Wzz/FepE/Etk N-terminal domain-containing protein n=1 Tax=Legionella sp. D16C41 TaxID=3402688 RepID=UPI003AF8E671
MTDNGDEKRLLEKKKFNEERIQAWKAQRLAAAELAAKERREKAESERATRAEQFRRQRQEEIDTVEKEKKKVAALDKLPSLEQIYRTKQAIVFEHHRKKRLFLKQITLLILISAILTCIISFFATPFYEAEAIVTIKTNSLNDNTLGSAILPTSVSPSIMQNIFSAREYIFSREK